MQSFADMCKPEPTPIPISFATYLQPDYSDIPDDWERIYADLDREDRECEETMRKLREQGTI